MQVFDVGDKTLTSLLNSAMFEVERAGTTLAGCVFTDRLSSDTRQLNFTALQGLISLKRKTFTKLLINPTLMNVMRFLLLLQLYA